MRTRLFILSALALVLTLTPTLLVSTSANTNLEIQAITDAKAGSVDLTFNSKFAKSSVVTYRITAKPTTLGAATYSKTFTKKVSGYISQRVTPLTPGTNYKFKVTIKTTNKKVFNSADFSFYTASTRPNVPVITKAIETDADEAVIYFDAPNNDGQTPVLYYTAYAYPGNATGITLQQGSGSITFTGLTKSTTYRFTVTAHNINGTSVASLLSEPVTTLANKIVRVIPASSSGGSTLAAPAFTLSLAAETKTVGILSTGYSITETGGTIASYSISPALPAGLSFNTSNGLVTGRATETRTATTHTITATNATGSASNTYRLRVTGDLGDTGPGGGRIFYYLAAGFNCGASFTDTGSPTGEKCRYLEVAPSGWNGGTDSITVWATLATNVSIPVVTTRQHSDAETLNARDIGVGYRDSRLIVNYGETTTAAAGAARAYTGGSLSDWYLGSPVEINLLCQWARGVSSSVTTICSGGASPSQGLNSSVYWSSTQADGFGNQWAFQVNFNGGSSVISHRRNLTGSVRPIRAF